MRPNIRVEIQNNLVEKMEVDDNEEGEISEDDDDDLSLDSKSVQAKTTNEPTQSTRSMLNEPVVDPEKLKERAKRFQLNPEDIRNFTTTDLQLLYATLGITAANESNVRLDTIHMRGGIDDSSAAAILDYFLDYAPVSIEWIDDDCCNVLWSDRLAAARALHFISKPVRGMPVRDDRGYFDETLADDNNTSVLLVNKDRTVELKEDEDEQQSMLKMLNAKNSVDISEITSTIPPGYWRLGKKHKNFKCVLLRFALKTDKKPFKSDLFAKYYKASGATRRPGRRADEQGIFGRNKDMQKENPWSVLAMNWDEDAKFRERERITYEPKLEVKSESLRVRLGEKRKEPPIANIENDDEIEEGQEVEGAAAEVKEVEVEKEPTVKRVKIPRMRMYADDEEEKMKRKKFLTKINKVMERLDDDSKSTDLRKVLNMNTRTFADAKQIVEPEQVYDLGSRLKNRSKKMIFEIKTEMDQVEQPISYKEYNKSRAWRDDDARSRRNRPRFDRGNYSRRNDRYEDEVEEDEEFEDYDRGSKPRSKVAVVIKTQKKPTVASAVSSSSASIWSRVGKAKTSSDSSSSSSDAESEESNNEEEDARRRTFRKALQIEINNDRYKK